MRTIALALVLLAACSSPDLSLPPTLDVPAEEAPPVASCREASFACERDPECRAYLACDADCGEPPALYVRAEHLCPDGLEVSR